MTENCVMSCVNPYVLFDHRMVIEWEEKLEQARNSGDVKAFLYAESELKNYRQMLSQSLKMCACCGKCTSVQDS